MTDTQQTVKAQVKNYRATPRKMRLLVDFVRGKNARRAMAELSFVNKRHAAAVKEVIASALANAADKQVPTNDLYIADIQVQEGKSLRRHRAGSRGRATVFKRRLSHIDVVLAPKQQTQTD